MTSYIAVPKLPHRVEDVLNCHARRPPDWRPRRSSHADSSATEGIHQSCATLYD